MVAARWGNGQTILDTPRVSQRFYEDCPGILLREKCRLIKMNRGWVGNGGTPPSFHLSWKSKEPTDSTWKGDSRADRVKTSSFRSEDERKRRVYLPPFGFWVTGDWPVSIFREIGGVKLLSSSDLGVPASWRGTPFISKFSRLWRTIGLFGLNFEMGDAFKILILDMVLFYVYRLFIQTLNSDNKIDRSGRTSIAWIVVQRNDIGIN